MSLPLRAGVPVMIIALVIGACRSLQHDGPDLRPPTIVVTHEGESTTTHTPSPPARAQRHLDACDGGDIASCHAAALDAYYSDAALETDERARLLFERACDGGYAPSCNGLGVLYAEGRGVPKDAAHALALYRAACIAGASTACQHLAFALEEARGTTRDPDAAGCAHGGRLLGAAPERPERRDREHRRHAHDHADASG